VQAVLLSIRGVEAAEALRICVVSPSLAKPWCANFGQVHACCSSLIFALSPPTPTFNPEHGRLRSSKLLLAPLERSQQQRRSDKTAKLTIKVL
jgi:hypothetical protein